MLVLYSWKVWIHVDPVVFVVSVRSSESMNLGGQALPESWASCRAGYLSKTINYGGAGARTNHSVSSLKKWRWLLRFLGFVRKSTLTPPLFLRSKECPLPDTLCRTGFVRSIINRCQQKDKLIIPLLIVQTGSKYPWLSQLWHSQEYVEFIRQKSGPHASASKIIWTLDDCVSSIIKWFHWWAAALPMLPALHANLHVQNAVPRCTLHENPWSTVRRSCALPPSKPAVLEPSPAFRGISRSRPSAVALPAPPRVQTNERTSHPTLPPTSPRQAVAQWRQVTHTHLTYSYVIFRVLFDVTNSMGVKFCLSLDLFSLRSMGHILCVSRDSRASAMMKRAMKHHPFNDRFWSTWKDG